MIYEDQAYLLKLLRQYRMASSFRFMKYTILLVPKDFDDGEHHLPRLVKRAERQDSLARDPSDGSYTKG